MNPLLSLAQRLRELREAYANTAYEPGREQFDFLSFLGENSLLFAAAMEELDAHRDYPDEDEMNTGDPENEAVNLMRMARLGTAMDATDAELSKVKLP